MDASFASSSLECFRLIGVKHKPSRKLLGRGAYGFVEEYTYRELKCAGKRLMPVLREFTTKEQEQALLKNVVKECQTLSTLKHPNIVQFLGVHFEEEDPIPILIMEYVPYTLSDFLDGHKHDVIPSEITYGILVDVAQALCYLHGGEPVIIHRDLSANNILLTTDLRAKVSDLGTVRILDISVREKIKQCKTLTKCPGTPVYMPPEACLETPSYNENIDCYSYGVLILHILNREWPVPADSVRDEDHQVVVLTDIDRRQKHINKVDPNHPLRDLILWCLDHKDKRPTAKEILEKVQVVQKQCCKAESDRLALLIQQRIDSENKTNLEKQIHKLKDAMEKQIDQLNNQIESNKHLHSEEAKGLAAEMDGLKSENDGLKSMKDSQETELEAMKERVQSISEMLRNKEEEVNSIEEKLYAYQEEKDGEIKELLRKKEEEITDLLHKKEEEISGIKKDAEEELHAYQKQKDDEVDSVKKEVRERLHAYQKQKDNEIAAKKKELDTYKEKLQKKEKIIDTAIKRDAERAEKAHEALHRSQSEKGTVMEYLRSGTQIHPLHHRAQPLKWRLGPSLPMGMTAPQCVVIKSSLYMGGGQTIIADKSCRSLIFEYDTSERNRESWRCPFSPCPTVYFGLGELNGKLVLVGGEREAEDKQTCITGDVFVPVEEGTGWMSEVIPALNTPRIRSCVVGYKGWIAACGGLEGSTRECSSAVEVYRSEGQEWCIVTPLPKPRAALRVSIIHKTAYLLGGFHPNLAGTGKPNCMGIELEDLFQTDVKKERKWNKEFRDCPCESSTPASLCGSLIALGGLESQDSHTTITKSIYAYSPAINKWHLIDNLPIQLSSATAITLTSGELIVFGGRRGAGVDRNNDVYIGSI